MTVNGFIIGMITSGLIWFSILCFIRHRLKYSKIKINSVFFVNTIFGIILSTISFSLEMSIPIPIIWKVFGGLIICGLLQFFSAIIYEGNEETAENDNEIISINKLLMFYFIVGLVLVIIGGIGIAIIAFI